VKKRLSGRMMPGSKDALQSPQEGQERPDHPTSHIPQGSTCLELPPAAGQVDFLHTVGYIQAVRACPRPAQNTET
jgi:hypothetical protein